MVTSAADRAALLQLFPDLPVRGLSGVALDRALDAWFANDHYADNPAYTWNDEESVAL